MIGQRLSKRPHSLTCFLITVCAFTNVLLEAATLPAGFTETLIASGISSPTAMQFAPDGRLFVCEQQGRLRVVKDGTLLPTPFVTLTVSSSGERGLLGVAFDPNFAANGYVYLYYTATTPTVHNRISRFTAAGDVAVAGSEVPIFDLDTLSSATNHNGGALAFGADGKLYAAAGENGNPANAQSLNNVLGKVLRMNSDGSIPTDNPFYSAAIGKNRAIWSLGLRNPFRFAFHPFDGRLFINDVGEGSWEEINDGAPGANYGWPDTEGATGDPRFVTPRHAYGHAGACAIVGGAFYAPGTAQFPADYANDYFFADYCGGWIRRLDPAAGNNVVTFATGISNPVDVKVADDGSLYYLERGNGSVYRIQYGATAPSITSHPASQTVAPGLSVTFSVRASGVPPLRYQWQRNAVDISGATGQDYVLSSASASDNGARFRARVSNDFGNVLSNEAVLTVTANQAPAGTITQPTSGMLYTGGAVIAYSGTGTDAEDGTLPASAFTWRVDFHHDTHTHPFMPPASGSRTGSFTVPTAGETSPNVWYRIYLTVRDSQGLTHTSQRDVFPQKAQLTLATTPPGLQVRLDGQPVSTPVSFDSVVGIVRSIEAPTPQTSGGTSYEFVSWSDGGARSHSIATPSSDTTYTSAYQASGTGSAISLVQRVSKDAGTTTASTLAFPALNTAGNWIAVCVRTSIPDDMFTVTDSRGNSYRRAAQVTVALDKATLAIFYAENINGGSNTVTIAHSQSGTLRFAILEYAGIALTNSLDVTAVGQGNSTTPTSGAASTASNGSLLIGAVMSANSARFTAGTGFVVRDTVPMDPNTKLMVEDRIQQAAGPAVASASIAAGDVWGVVMAAFRPAATLAPPAAPSSPGPSNGGSGVSTTPTLTWTAPGATSYDVRFGTTDPAPIVATNLTTAAYSPPALSNGTTYFWQVVARNAAGTTTGASWSFTTVAAAPSGIALVQHAGRDAGTTTSTTVAFPSANAVGNLIAVCVRAAGLDQVFSVTDSRGNQYRKAVQFNVINDNVSLGIFYAENIGGGTNTVTVSDSQAATLRVAALEYSGVAISNSLDVVSTAEGFSSAPNSGTVTPTSDGSLILAALTTANPASVAPGTGYALRLGVPGSPAAKLSVEDRVQPIAGATTATAALAQDDYWGVVVAAFRPAR